VSLLNDTGKAGNRITNSPDLKIMVGDSNAIAELLVSLDGTKWQNMKSSLLNNVVTIDRPSVHPGISDRSPTNDLNPLDH
jgi:hypothetical protein